MNDCWKDSTEQAVNPRIVLFSESGATTTFGDKCTHFHNHTPYPLSSYQVAQRQSGGGFQNSFCTTGSEFDSRPDS